MSDVMNECVIEWIKGEKVAGVTMPNNTKLKNRILKIAETRKEVEVTMNADGSIYARIPSSWVKINPNRELSAEEKEYRRNKMMDFHRQRKMSTLD